MILYDHYDHYDRTPSADSVGFTLVHHSVATLSRRASLIIRCASVFADFNLFLICIFSKRSWMVKGRPWNCWRWVDVSVALHLLHLMEYIFFVHYRMMFGRVEYTFNYALLSLISLYWSSLTFWYCILAYSLSWVDSIVWRLRLSNVPMSFSTSLFGVPIPSWQNNLQCFLRLFSIWICYFVVESGYRVRARRYWGRIRVLKRLTFSLNFAFISRGLSCTFMYFTFLSMALMWSLMSIYLVTWVPRYLYVVVYGYPRRFASSGFSSLRGRMALLFLLIFMLRRSAHSSTICSAFSTYSSLAIIIRSSANITEKRPASCNLSRRLYV